MVVYADIPDELYAEKAAKIVRLIKEAAESDRWGAYQLWQRVEHEARVARCQAEREYSRSDERYDIEESSD